MSERAILLAIKQVYAENILNGERTKEYRSRPPRISKPTRAILYVSGTRQIVGECVLEPVCGDRTTSGYPLPVRNPFRYAQPIPWKSIRQEIPRIRPPQRSFRYLKPTNASDAKLLEMVERPRVLRITVDSRPDDDLVRFEISRLNDGVEEFLYELELWGGEDEALIWGDTFSVDLDIPWSWADLAEGQVFLAGEFEVVGDREEPEGFKVNPGRKEFIRIDNKKQFKEMINKIYSDLLTRE